MGRGSGEHFSDFGIGPRRRESSQDELRFVDFISNKVSGFIDLKLVRSGVLEGEQEGQAMGTPFVVIATETEMGGELARQHFAAYCSTTDLAWEYGWTPIPWPTSKWFKELTLYASSDYFWADFEGVPLD
jgi:hypothetical protein